MKDDLLERATAAYREELGAESNEVGFATLQRALARRKRAPVRRAARRVAYPLVAALVALTAWAGASGRLTELLSLSPPEVPKAPPLLPAEFPRAKGGHAPNGGGPVSLPPSEPVVLMGETETPAARSEAIPPAPLSPDADRRGLKQPPGLGRSPGVRRTNREDPSAADRAKAPTEPVSSEVATPLPEAVQPVTPAPVVPGATDPAPGGGTGASEDELYRAAHVAHFVAKDYASAIAAWDRYLKTQRTGRFALEARYNRALCLVRLGRASEAREALLPFAEGDYGAYRQQEAKALLGALANSSSAR